MERKDSYLNRREEEMEYLIQLATEIDVCLNDLSKLVELGESVAHGEEPSVDTLIGIPHQLQLSLMPANRVSKNSHCNGSSTFHGDAKTKNSECDDSDDIDKCSASHVYTNIGDEDPEWILERLKNVRDMRKSIEKLRNHLIDLYTDILEGSTDTCSVQ